MSKKITIILIVIAVLLIGGGIYYFLSQTKVSEEGTSPSAAEQQEQIPTKENKFGLEEYMLEAYSDYLEGTISFSDDTATFETNGKIYILQPKNPKFYKNEGFKDGQTVRIQGKVVKEKYLTVGVIK